MLRCCAVFIRKTVRTVEMAVGTPLRAPASHDGTPLLKFRASQLAVAIADSRSPTSAMPFDSQSDFRGQQCLLSVTAATKVLRNRILSPATKSQQTHSSHPARQRGRWDLEMKFCTVTYAANKPILAAGSALFHTETAPRQAFTSTCPSLVGNWIESSTSDSRAAVRCPADFVWSSPRARTLVFFRLSAHMTSLDGCKKFMRARLAR
jgi:hypothetical protein